MSTSQRQWVSLDMFEVDYSVQPRPYLSKDAVKRYTQTYRSDAARLPPITLARLKDGRTVLVDGFHRVAAAKAAGLTRLPAETMDADRHEVQWLAVEANLRHGVPIPRRQKREVFKRFVRARQNRRPNGSPMSSRELERALPIASHTALLGWMREDFPKVYAEMVGDDPEEVPEERQNSADRLRDEAMSNLHWAQRQLEAALSKALRVVPSAELAASLRGTVGDLEGVLGRPLVTVEELLDTLHGRTLEFADDY